MQEDNWLKACTEAQIFFTVVLAMLLKCDLTSEYVTMKTYNELLIFSFGLLVPFPFAIAVYKKFRAFQKITATDDEKLLEESSATMNVGGGGGRPSVIARQTFLGHDSSARTTLRRKAVAAEVRGDANAAHREVLLQYHNEMIQRLKERQDFEQKIFDAKKYDEPLAGIAPWRNPEGKDIAMRNIGILQACVDVQSQNEDYSKSVNQSRYVFDQLLGYEHVTDNRRTMSTKSTIVEVKVLCTDKRYSREVIIKATMSDKIQNHSYTSLSEHVLKRLAKEVQAMKELAEAHAAANPAPHIWNKESASSSIIREYSSFVQEYSKKCVHCMVIEAVGQSARSHFKNHPGPATSEVGTAEYTSWNFFANTYALVRS